MVHSDMDDETPILGTMLKTKDFAAVCEDDAPGAGWYITSARISRMSLSPDAASQWLLHEPAQGLLKQFWSHERRRFEAADNDEAYALLIHVQMTFNNRTLN